MNLPRAAEALVAGRSCGQCTVCCQALEIAALGKPAGAVCRHSTGTACGIYPDRPAACVRWHCLWRKVGALPDTLRPDRSGVLFSLDRHAPCADALEGACIVGRAVAEAGALDHWAAVEAFAMFTREGSLPVWRVAGRQATRIHPGS